MRGYGLVIWGTAGASTEVTARFTGGTARAMVIKVGPKLGDPVAAHDRGRVLQQQRLGQAAGGEERAAGAEDGRDLVDDHLVDQPELERLAADLTGGHVGDPVAGEHLAAAIACSTPSTNVNGAVPAYSQSVGGDG